MARKSLTNQDLNGNDITNVGNVNITSPGNSTGDALTVDGSQTLTNKIIDLDGDADALILDADGDTTISAPTDDVIDFEVGGVDVLKLDHSTPNDPIMTLHGTFDPEFKVDSGAGGTSTTITANGVDGEDGLVLNSGGPGGVTINSTYGISGTAIKDEDDMSSDSDSHLATQQSIKAYVDANAGGSGDVTAASNFGTDNSLIRSDGTGKGVQSSGITVSDIGELRTIDNIVGENALVSGRNGGASGQLILNGGVAGNVTIATGSTGAGMVVSKNINITGTEGNSSGDVITTDGTQTLTNKTINADNNTLSNIEVDNFKASAIVTESEGIENNDNDTTIPTSAAVFDLSEGLLVQAQLNAQGLVNAHAADTTTHGTTGDIVGTSDNQTLINKTLTSPVINTGVSGTAILDEDDMSSNSATQLATQQSIKAYVDANAGGGITWSEVTGTSQTAAVNTAYIANNASLVTVTLPSTAAVGDIVRVVGKGAGGWKIAQNSGQTINFGIVSTTTGTGGSLESYHEYDAVELVCITANTTFNVISSQGSMTVV